MIPGRCFQIATNAGEIILDPFGGGGSSYEAAEQLDRYWIGCEINTTEAIVARFKDRFPGLSDTAPPSRLLSVFR